MLRLYVCVLEAKDLPVKNSYVKLKLGKSKSKTRTLRDTCNPVWNEECVFKVQDGANEELVVSVFFNHNDNDDGGGECLEGNKDCLLGEVRIPVGSVACEDKQILPPTWFSLDCCNNTGKFVNIYCGKILLTISLRGKEHAYFLNDMNSPRSNNVAMEDHKDLAGSPRISSQEFFIPKVPRCKIPEGKQLMKVVAKYANRLDRVFNKKEDSSKSCDSSEPSNSLSDNEDIISDDPSPCGFEEAIALMESRDNKLEMPENLSGGILVDQVYLVSAYDLNALLFAPNSQFRRELAEMQRTANVQEGPWTWKSGDTSCLTRVVSYTKAATKLFKAVKATEEQTYVRVSKEEFAVLINVSTPDVPYGSSFKIELLYKIVPEKEQSAEKCSHLVVSWGIVFMQSTMMRGMIEGGARQGLKDSFDQFSDLLAQKLKKLDTSDLSNKEQVLATMQTKDHPNWRLAIKYFFNFRVLSTIVMFVYVLVHIFRCGPSKIQGLEFKGLDLPDSFGELITSGILAIQLQHVYNMLFHFIKARIQMGSDHGLKANGEGWILTVALVEGVDLTSLESSGLSDPYVVLTCNGKTRSSSVKLQTRAPQWNEILEFDAMGEPPSVLDVEVFDFDGPFDQHVSLGHAEINFLKHTSIELADMWVSLEGKLAQSSQSKLHLRIFLDNNKGVETIRGYLIKKGKEVGKRLNLRSPHRNSTFQKLFGLPPEEFLISDFTCSLRRKLLLQGRLFLSARIMGFYANLFGQKTKFFFLWEDIEDIQVLPPSVASLGSPTLVIILRKDRGLDARHGAKIQDEEGRLRFYFQSFVSFGTACRTMKGLWRTRILNPDLKAQIAEEQEDQEEGPLIPDDFGSMLDDEAMMSKIYSAEFPFKMKLLMELFDGGNLEQKIMQQTGCVNYGTTSWESLKPNVFERCISYKFSRQVSVFGGEVTCTQQKVPIENNEGWIVNEVMALHGVPFSDHFRIHFRYQIEKSAVDDCGCKCETFIRIVWLKSSKFQQRINQNITSKFTNRLKEIFEMLQKEVLFMSQKDSSIEALS